MTVLLVIFQSTPSAWRETSPYIHQCPQSVYFNPLPPHGGRRSFSTSFSCACVISIHSLRMEGDWAKRFRLYLTNYFNPLPPHGGRPLISQRIFPKRVFQSTPSAWRETYRPDIKADCIVKFQSTPSAWRETQSILCTVEQVRISIHSLRMEGDGAPWGAGEIVSISIHSLRMEGDSKTAQESVFHFAYPCTILQKRMQKTTFCTRKNGFFRKKGEKFGAKPSASFCAPMIRTDTFPLNFSHRISGSSMSMVSFAPICSTFD